MRAPVQTMSAARSRSTRNRARTFLPAALAGVLSVVGLVPLAAPAAAESLADVGPIDNAHGYPFWFEDSDGLRLELCLDPADPLCPLVDALPDPSQPASVPENFTDEAFWWSGEAAIDAPSGASALLVMAQEAAFGGPGEVAFGQQVAFQRMRVRIDDAVPLATYAVTTPYGELELEADDRGRVRFTEDRGCLAQPCDDFGAARNGPIGPFLRWDEGAPAGYVGDPTVEHAVVGSPTGDNFFRVEGPGLTGAGDLDGMIETDRFAVQGRIATPRATITHVGDLYEPGTVVTITSSFPDESDVVYTVDGSDPLAEASTATIVPAPSDGEVPVTLPLVEGPMTLAYAVVTEDGQQSEVYEQAYDLRAGLSVVTATPGPAVAPAVLEGRQDVVLTAGQEGRIFYTTDGTRPRVDGSGIPTGSTRVYTGPITITRTTMVKAFSLPDPVAPTPEVPEPPAPQAGPVAAFHYQIHNLRAVSAEITDGYPFSLTDIGLPGALPGDARQHPAELELCLDDPLCPVVGELPDPTRGISFPDNFPDESFWWSGEAEFDTADGGRARLILAAEAAFDGNGAVAVDHQIGFGRIRVRMDDMLSGATYEIAHPYGTVRATADDRGRVAYTDDNGCMNAVCGFERMLTQPVGPFLRWDPARGPAAPAGYVGDPNVTHTVVGSPYGTNAFVVHQVTDGQGTAIPRQLIGQTDQFAVQGKLPGPGVVATWQTGAFNQQLDVTLTGNHLTDEIRYTLDGSDPVTSGEDYDGPIHIGEGTTTLRYVGVGHGQTSMVEEEVYTVDSIAPTVAATPGGGEFSTAQSVTLTANEPAQIFYTVNGSTPTQTSLQFAGQIRVANSLTLKAIAVDNAGNVGQVGTWSYTITPPPPSGGDTGGGTGTGGAAGTPTAPVALGTALVLEATVAAVDSGARTTLNGVLAVNGQAVAGAPVVLQTRALATTGRLHAASGWVDLSTATTAADGSYAFTDLKPTATADYRVVFAGDAIRPAMVSPVQRVEVRAVVKLSHPEKRVERRERFALRGQLAPVHRGAVVLVRLDGPGRAADKAKATVTRQGTWKIVVRAPHVTGRWKVVAVWRGDVDHLGSTSTTRTIRVVR